MAKHGIMYGMAEFVSRTVPARGLGGQDQLRFVKRVLAFLMELQDLQDSNPSLTVSFSLRDGLWLYHNGASKCFIKPTQKHLLFHVFKKNELSDAVEEVASRGRLFKDRRKVPYAYGVWGIGGPEMTWLERYIKDNMKPPREPIMAKEAIHPRSVPGDVRQAVLTSFNNEGRWCPGVAGKTRRHKLNQEVRIEFDHILPYSKGGSTSWYNVQILCAECNRIKSGTAL